MRTFVAPQPMPVDVPVITTLGIADGSSELSVAGFVVLLYAFRPAAFFTRNMSGMDEAPTSLFARFANLVPSLFGFDFGYGVSFGVHVRASG
jgi:hypothetical protein